MDKNSYVAKNNGATLAGKNYYAMAGTSQAAAVFRVWSPWCFPKIPGWNLTRSSIA